MGFQSESPVAILVPLQFGLMFAMLLILGLASLARLSIQSAESMRTYEEPIAAEAERLLGTEAAHADLSAEGADSMLAEPIAADAEELLGTEAAHADLCAEGAGWWGNCLHGFRRFFACELGDGSDAYKILFASVYTVNGIIDWLEFVIACALISLQLIIVIVAISYYNGAGGTEETWRPFYTESRHLLAARGIAGYILLFFFSKDIKRCHDLLNFAATHPVQATLGTMCAWLLAAVSLAVLWATIYLGFVQIVTAETVIDVFKDFTALAFISEIDDFPVAGRRTIEKSKWHNKFTPKNFSSDIGITKKCMIIINRIFAIVGFVTLIEMLSAWVPLHSISLDELSDGFGK